MVFFQTAIGDISALFHRQSLGHISLVISLSGHLPTAPCACVLSQVILLCLFLLSELYNPCIQINKPSCVAET